MLLGETGVGKSTLTHFLAGTILKKGTQNEIKHLELDKFSNDCDLNEIKKIKVSALPESCTKSIYAIKVKHEKSKLLICDSPGIQDTRGSEIEIANTYGLVKAAQSCKSVVPIIILSKDSMGERMKGLKNMLQQLSNMFNNIEQFLPKI